MNKIIESALAIGLLFAASPAAALTPHATTIIRGVLYDSGGTLDLSGGYGPIISFNFSKPITLDGNYTWFADAVSMDTNHSDDHGYGRFGGYGTRFLFDESNQPYYDGFMQIDGVYATFSNANLVPVSYSITFSQSVPEPAAWIMMIVGIGFIGAAARKAKAKPVLGSSISTSLRQLL